MKKMTLILTILVLCFTVTGIVAAAPSAEKETSQIVLKVGYQEGGYGSEFLKYAIKTFEAKYPNVKIDLTLSPDLATVVSTMAQAKNDKDMFDIFTGNDPYAGAGLLEPINDILEQTFADDPGLKIKDGLYPGVFNTLDKNAKGEIYRMPRAIYVGGLFYDKAFFKEHGWNENPQTWNEFMALCEDIKSDGVIPLTFSGLYNYIGFSVWWNKEFELAELNGTLDKVKGDYVAYRSPRYNTPEMIELYTRLYQMGQKGYFSKGLAALDHTQSQMQMLKHEVAMVSTADWVENEMKSAGAVPAGFQWGYMSIPFGNKVGDTIWLNNGDSDSAVIWKNKPEETKKWAKEFIKWTLNLDVQRNMAIVAGAMPVRAAFYNDQANLDKLTSSQKAISAYMGSHKTRLENNFTIRPKLGPSDSQADKVFVEAVPLICQGELEPKAILDQAEALFIKGIEEGKALSK